MLFSLTLRDTALTNPDAEPERFFTTNRTALSTGA